MAPGPAPSDRDLVALAQRGDRDAFSQLVVRHQDRLYTAVYRFCGHAEDAGDIVQRSFVNAYRSLGSFKSDSAFSTWIYRIAFNQFVSFRREAGGRRPVSLYGKDEEMTAEPEFTANPGEGLEREDAQRQVQKVLLLLDDEDRRIIVLKDLQERSYEEIAEILQIPKGTVRSRLHRARSALKEKGKTLLGTPSQS